MHSINFTVYQTQQKSKEVILTIGSQKPSNLMHIVGEKAEKINRASVTGSTILSCPTYIQLELQVLKGWGLYKEKVAEILLNLMKH